MASRSNDADEVRDAYALSAESVLAHLVVDPARGLFQAEVDGRIEQHGQNSLTVPEGVRWPVILGRQFADVLIVILAAAVALSLLIGEALDAAVIAAILVFNALLGFTPASRRCSCSSIASRLTIRAPSPVPGPWRSLASS